MGGQLREALDELRVATDPLGALLSEGEAEALLASHTALVEALKEQLAADDALTAFVLGADPHELGEAEWDRQHRERSERRRRATLASRAAVAKAEGRS